MQDARCQVQDAGIRLNKVQGLTVASGSSSGKTGGLPGLSGSQYSWISRSSLSAHAYTATPRPLSIGNMTKKCNRAGTKTPKPHETSGLLRPAAQQATGMMAASVKEC